MNKRKKGILFAIFILFLMIFPLVQIIFNLIPSEIVTEDSQIKIIPKYFDDPSTNFNLQANNINPKDKIDPYINDLLNSDDLEKSIPIIVYLSYQPGNSIALKLKYEYKMKENADYYKKLYELTKSDIQYSQNQLLKRISDINVTIKNRFSIVNAISMEIPLKNLQFLISDPNISQISYDYELKAALHYSVPSILEVGSNVWDLSSYNGSNVVVAVLDSGINENHYALAGRIIDRYNALTGGTDAADDNYHGTYVTGIIANNDTYSHGVAPNVSLINVKIFDNNGDGNSGWLMAGVEWVLTQAVTKPDIINFSGGNYYPDLDNGMSSLTIFIDAITSMYNVLWINAAGNTPSSIEIPADAYNSIAVGALVDPLPRDTNRNNDVLASFYSSKGPTTDGRLKPDIVAQGGQQQIYNSFINSCKWDDDFGWRNDRAGTSFSAPHVTGAAALIYDYLKQNTNVDKAYYPLVTKALLLSTADDWSSSGPASDGPDYSTGWGYINLANVWNLTQKGVVFETNSLSYDNINYKEPFYYNLTLNKDEIFNITMTWNRHANYIGGLMFVYGNGRPNNLNLYLLTENLTVVASSTDPLNNIEHISYLVPETGRYYLEVICQDSQYFAPEPYAMVSTHNLSKVNPDAPRLLYYSLSPDLDVDLDYFLFRSFDAYERISFYTLMYDEDGIIGGTFNMPLVRQMFLPPIDYYFPIFQIFPNVLYFNLILQDLYIERGLEQLTKIFLDGSIWATFTVFDANSLSRSSSTFYIILDYHGVIWNLSISAIVLLTILIIVDFIREGRAKVKLKEIDEERYKKEMSGEFIY